jgi:hypothetical protein
LGCVRPQASNCYERAGGYWHVRRQADSLVKLALEKQTEIADRATCHFDVDYRR